MVDNQTTHELSLSPGKYAMLSVEDNGAGIPKENLNKIFSPYFTTKTEGRGTGLGLSVVYGIVKEHKGEIFVNSEIGKGTIFEIYFPLMVDESATDIKTTEIPVEAGTERILVVDDEASIAELEKQILERLGYNVSTRTSSLDALEAFKANPEEYDLILTDMSMPNMTGEKFAIEILRLRPDIAIIICTGFSEYLTQERAMQMGVKGFLMKPIVRNQLAREVRRVLDETK